VRREARLEKRELCAERRQLGGLGGRRRLLPLEQVALALRRFSELLRDARMSSIRRTGRARNCGGMTGVTADVRCACQTRASSSALASSASSLPIFLWCSATDSFSVPISSSIADASVSNLCVCVCV
jgi:hypothetical protein